MQNKIKIAANAIKDWISAGRPRMDYMGSNLPAAVEAVIDAMRVEQDSYWRGTNRADEIVNIRNGVAIISKNHADGCYERGLSVSKTLGTVFAGGYKYAYKVTGDVICYGSDGEPVLANVVAVSDLMMADDAIANDAARAHSINTAKAIADLSGIDVATVLWIESR